MSVKSKSAKKKPAVKKATAKKVTAKKTTKKATAKKSVAKKATPVKASKKKVSAVKAGVKKSSMKKATAKKSTASKVPSALPGTKLIKAFQSAQMETKKLLAPASKKVAQLKQQFANAAKKLKTEQENINKLEQKHKDKPGVGVAKQLNSAKNKFKATSSTHSKAENAHNVAAASLAKLQNHYDKICHLEKGFKQGNTTWDQQNAHVGKVQPVVKINPVNKNKPNTSTVVGTSNKASNMAAKPSNNAANNKAKSAVSNLDNDNVWTKFDANKEGSVFAKLDKLADYDSSNDADKDQWRKS